MRVKKRCLSIIGSSKTRHRRLQAFVTRTGIFFIIVLTLRLQSITLNYSEKYQKTEENSIWIPSKIENNEPESGQTCTKKIPEASSNNKTDLKLVRIQMSDLPERPYIFPNGSFKYGSQETRWFPIHPEESPGYDRLLEQSLFNPSAAEGAAVKTIMVMDGFSWFRSGKKPFLRCPVRKCVLRRPWEVPLEKADLVVFTNGVNIKRTEKHRRQIWVLYILESPLHSSAYSEPHSVNWTATYRSDSDIATPHGKWMYFDERVQSQEQNTNLAMNKTKKVAWFVSNCETVNHRLDYVKELSKYIQVDIFGACGSLVCPRNNASTCSVMLRDTYKFYLAFENSNCKDYITEKFFNNALTNNVIPIVMGANKEDYLKAAPLNSFLHINDFESAKELAEKLNEIDKDDDQFNAFFKWQGTGDFVDTNFMCILCGMIHDPQKREKSYMDTKHWWQNNTCGDSIK